MVEGARQSDVDGVTKERQAERSGSPDAIRRAGNGVRRRSVAQREHGLVTAPRDIPVHPPVVSTATVSPPAYL